MKFRGDQSGQAVIEAIIALSALLVLLAAIAVVITTSLSNTTFSSNQDQANKHAQEGMEIIRNYSRSNKLLNVGGINGTIFTLIGSFCMGDDGEISPGGPDFSRDGCGVNLENAYVRTVSFEQGFCSSAPFEGAEVTVDVAWSSGKCTCDDPATCSIADRYCHSASLISCFARPQSSTQL